MTLHVLFVDTIATHDQAGNYDWLVTSNGHFPHVFIITWRIAS